MARRVSCSLQRLGVEIVVPAMPEIEASFPGLRFIELDRDRFMPLAKEWDIFGIPSFLILEGGKEVARFVDRNRKTKAQVMQFIEEN